MTNLEIEKERSKISDQRNQARKELDMYMENLKHIEVERKEEDKILNKLLDEHRAAVEKKQSDAKCAVIKAKKELEKVTSRKKKLHCGTN